MAITAMPVTIITGFLGSGKTTLLNRILTEAHGEKIAVIVNEFGEIGIDNQLILGNTDEEIFEMNNGCICCTVRGDLIRTLTDLYARRKEKESNGSVEFDRVVIETTGLADPAPVIQTFFADSKIQRRYYPDAVITVVDSKHIEQHLDDGHEAVEQIAFADLVLLNKTDLVSSEHLSQLENRIKKISATTRVIRTEHSQIPIEEILDIRAFDLSQKLEIDPGFLEEEDHEHDQSVTSVGLREEVPLERMRFQYWLQNLLSTKGQDIFRFKGVLNIKGRDERVVAQGVHMLSTQAVDRPWEAGEPRISEMVFIGRNLDADELRSGLSGCRARTEVKQL
jgi:G3E family GTPase